jgi:ribokinase
MVCVVGSANIDLTFRTPRLPAAGETVAAQGLQVGCGGKGANQAVMAALLGARVRLIARIGADSFGRQILDGLRTRGVDTAHILVDSERPTGTACVVVDDEARNCIVVADGANGRLSTKDMHDAGDTLRSAKVLLCQLETPVAATVAAFRIARAAGVRTVLNPAPAKSLPDELLQMTDLCVPNETEASLLTGIDASGPEGAVAAARSLRHQGPRAVIVTLGSRGCVIDAGEGPVHVPAWPVAAVDPTGAGDAFLGALAVALAEGIGLHDAVPRATAAAALSVTRPGALASFPSRAEVDAFLSNASDPAARTDKHQPQGGHHEA